MRVKKRIPFRMQRLDRDLTDRVRDKARRQKVGDGYRDSVEFAMRFYLNNKKRGAS